MDRKAPQDQGHKPGFIVMDHNLIKNILVKDFNHFVDHSAQLSEVSSPLQAKNLFNMHGDRWRTMRAKLTPTFTSGRIKQMFPLVLNCANNLEKFLHLNNSQHLDIKDIMARYTTDVIGNCTFGIQCDSLQDPYCQFREMGRKIFATSTLVAFKKQIARFSPQTARVLRISSFSAEVTNFFRQLVKDVMEQRATSGEIHKDFMQLLIEIKNKGSLENTSKNSVGTKTKQPEQAWTNDDVTAQALVFFLAGFETSSSALTFALFELARRPELQKRARAHIEEVLQRYGGKISYEALQDMSYLNWILQESLRKYPPLVVLPRICTKNYKIPDTDITIEAGTSIAIPVQAIQNDPRIFPEPGNFIPERFADNGVNQYNYMPFGEGPRQCIGTRFARLQSKLGLLAVLRHFEVQPSEKTKYPLTMDPKQFLLSSGEDIFVQIRKIDEK